MEHFVSFYVLFWWIKPCSALERSVSRPAHAVPTHSAKAGCVLRLRAGAAAPQSRVPGAQSTAPGSGEDEARAGRPSRKACLMRWDSRTVGFAGWRRRGPAGGALRVAWASGVALQLARTRFWLREPVHSLS